MPAVQGTKRLVDTSRSYHRPRSTSIRLSPLRVKPNAAYNTKECANLNKSSRRVRFALPSSDGGILAGGGGGGGGGRTPARMLPAVASSTRRFSSSVIGTSAPHSRTSRRPSNISTTASIPAVADARRPIAIVIPARRLHHQQQQSSTSSSAQRERKEVVNVAVAASPGVRSRVHPTGRYAHGNLSPTANLAAPIGGGGAAPPPLARGLLKAAADGDDDALRDLMRRVAIVTELDLNITDRSGRTILSHLASNGPPDVLERILLLPGLHPNRPDNEGNTPLHFAAQAGQTECLNCMLTRCKTIEVDARNNMGFTPLMKAALQGRYKCAKMLLFAGANPTLKDDGRSLRADQWARFCGRYVCADVIEKHARQKLLERTTSYGNWGHAPDRSPILTKMPITSTIVQHSTSIRSKLKKVFRTSSSGATAAATAAAHEASSIRLVTQLTTAALCASTPVLPAAPSVPPVVKSLMRPLTVPRLQITLVNGDGDCFRVQDRSSPSVVPAAPPPQPQQRTKKRSK